MLKTLRDTLLAGLVIFLPLAASIFVLYFTFRWIENLISPAVHKISGFYVPGFSLLFLFLTILILGLLSRFALGRKIIERLEKSFLKVPLLRTIYSATKEAVKVLVEGEAERIRGVVLVEYPRRGIYAIGFTSGKSIKVACEKTGKNLVNVFIPTSPNPTSGLVVLVPEEELIYLDISVEEAMKIVISGGFSN